MDHWNEVSGSEVRITPRLVDSFYREAMILTDDARSYLDDRGRDEREDLAPGVRVSFACESLKITTRIMHIVAWLLTQRAIESGEIPDRQGTRPQRRLGNAPDSDPKVVERLPEAARRLVIASADLYGRVKRLDEGTLVAETPQSPARALMGRLEHGLAAIGAQPAYSRDEFERLMIEGIGTGGRKLNPMMEDASKESFSRMTPRQREALYAYLKARAELPQ